MKHIILSLPVVLILTILACSGNKNEAEKSKKLPFLGRHEYNEKDTVYHTIADFKFVDQDSNWVTNDTFKDKIYVADFFFTSCPTICPVMKAQMLRVYDSIQGDPDVRLLSHTIDPRHDSVPVLRAFATKLDVVTVKWHFVTGDKDEIYKLGQTSYMVSASQDPSEPGGYIHSGAFILVDKNRHVRGIYDGTKTEQVDQLIRDLDILRNEKG